MKQLSKKRRVATWLASLLVLFLVVSLLPTGFSKVALAQNEPKLIIRKEVKNNNDAGSFDFTLNVEKKHKENSFQYVKYASNGTEAGSGTFSFEVDEQFTLGHGEWIEFYGVKNEDFTLAEDISNEYDTSFEKSSGHDIEPVSLNKIKSKVHNGQGSDITVTNTYKIPEPVEGKTTKLVIEKRIENQNQLPDGSYVFKFEIIVDGDDLDEKTLIWTKNGHSISRTSIVIEELPVGASYSVKEVLDDDDAFTLVEVDSTKVIVFDEGEGTASGILAEGRKTVLTFRNEYTPSCDPGQELDPDPKLIVEKIVVGSETDEEFEFQVTEISPSDVPTINAFVLNTPFNLVHGESKDMIAVPGTKYKVTETPVLGYTITASLTVVGGSEEGSDDFDVDEDGIFVFDYPSDAESVTVTFTNTWEDEVGDDNDDDSGEESGGTSGGDPVEEPGDTSGDVPGEESGDTPDTDSGDETTGDETPGDEIVAGDEDEKPDEVVKGDEDEKAEEEELDVPVTGEGLSAYPFLALAMALLAAAFLALGRRKPLEED